MRAGRGVPSVWDRMERREDKMERSAILAALPTLLRERYGREDLSLRLLREGGYRYRGNVQVTVEPGRDPARQAYEKILKK